MISIIAPTDDLGAIGAFMEAIPPHMEGKLRLIDYASFLDQETYNPGILVFGNLFLMPVEVRTEVEFVCDQLEASCADVRIFNDPSRALDRLDFLSAMNAHGINDFAAYLPEDCDLDALKYPVFLRDQHMHTGNISELLHSRDELEKALRDYKSFRYGRRKADLIVVEHLDTVEPDGVYRKYCVFRFGDTILAKRVNFDYTWVVKFSPTGFVDRATGEIVIERVNEDIAYAEQNPHQEWARRVFKLAGIQYGRLDYGEYKGRLQAWEINTYPEMGRRPRKKRSPEHNQIREALREMRGDQREIFRADLFGAMEQELSRVEPGLPVAVNVPLEMKRNRLAAQKRGELRDRLNRAMSPVITGAASIIPSDGWVGKMRQKCRQAIKEFMEPHDHRTVG